MLEHGQHNTQELKWGDFPGGLVVKNSPGNAGHGPNAGPGRSTAAEQLSPWPQLLSTPTTAAEACSTTRGATTTRSPRNAARVGPSRHNWRKPVQQWRPGTAKNLKIINKYKKELRWDTMPGTEVLSMNIGGIELWMRICYCKVLNSICYYYKFIELEPVLSSL